MLETFDSSKLSNIYSGIYENARVLMGEGYGPAYTFNRLGIVYDSAFCDVEIRSTSPTCGTRSWRAASPGRKSPLLRPAVPLCDGRRLCLEPARTTRPLRQAGRAKLNVVKTCTYSANDTINMLNQGEISVAVLLDYSYTTAKNANPDYIWLDPAQGPFSAYNMLNIVKGCENKELAGAFIDYYLSYDVQLAEALDGVGRAGSPGRRADRRAGCQTPPMARR